ncbi:MAG: GFA family protein [Proteobacteria bacterium]|nr:GFA family protein [Pseudomonadota bacterium]MBI3497807.1 GFA family protein [Pseudomonadota bacterium]
MGEAATVREGGCLCGAVRFQASGPPHKVNYCHCRMCQKASGAPVVTWATYARGQVTFTLGCPTIYQSSAQAQRGFCSVCGTPLLWHGVGDPNWIDLTVGAFDEPDALPPEEHIWTQSRIRWLAVADSLPQHSKRGPRSTGYA